jgi:heme-degrading monooxygenase HmoA
VRAPSVPRRKSAPCATPSARRSQANIPGYLFDYVFKLDKGENEYILVVGFESREAYQANANDPGQHERYLQYRELLEAEPEWNDGEIVHSYRA